jgi:hypothetical protein
MLTDAAGDPADGGEKCNFHRDLTYDELVQRFVWLDCRIIGDNFAATFAWTPDSLGSVAYATPWGWEGNFQMPLWIDDGDYHWDAEVWGC